MIHSLIVILSLILSSVSFATDQSSEKEIALRKKFIERATFCQRALMEKTFNTHLGYQIEHLNRIHITGEDFANFLDRLEFNSSALKDPALYQLLMLSATHPHANAQSLSMTARIIWKRTYIESEDTYPNGIGKASVKVFTDHLNPSLLSIDQAVWLMETILLHKNHGDGALSVLTWILRDQPKFVERIPELLTKILEAVKTEKRVLEGIAEVVGAHDIPNGVYFLEQILIHPITQKNTAFYGALPEAARAVGTMPKVEAVWAEDYLNRVLQKEEETLKSPHTQKSKTVDGNTVQEVFRAASNLYKRKIFSEDQLISFLIKAALHPSSDRRNTYRFLIYTLEGANQTITKSTPVFEALAKALNIELESVSLAMNLIMKEAKTGLANWNTDLKTRLANVLETFSTRGQKMKAEGQQVIMRCNCSNTHDNLNADEIHWNQQVQDAEALVKLLRQN